MATEPIWLTGRVVKDIHYRQIRQHGGSYGVRDEGLIESALARPQNRWEGSGKADLPALAAAYGFGLVKNHGFVDGNKRVGYMAMYVFLALNGLEIEAVEEEVVSVVTEVASSGRGEEALAEWLRQHTIPLE